MDNDETAIGAELLEILDTVMECIGIAIADDKAPNWAETVEETVSEALASIDTFHSRIKAIPDEGEQRKLAARVTVIYDGIQLILAVGNDAESVLFASR